MKSIGVTLQRTYLTKNCKNNHCATSNILDKKDKVNFKFKDIRAWLRNTCNTHIANISRGKGNQAMKFGQLIEFNMRNIFLKKTYTKWVWRN